MELVDPAGVGPSHPSGITGRPRGAGDAGGTSDRGVELNTAPRLSLLYTVRSVAALAWIAALVLVAPGVGESSPSVELRLLVALYPFIDALACLVDLSFDRTLPNQLGHGIEMTVSFAAAAWIAVAGQSWEGTILLVGYWAIATGAIQLVVALQRIHRFRGQWFMVISGAGSVAAGLSFTSWHGDGDASVALITQYAGGGLLWYLVAAAWATFRRGHHRESRAPTRA